jgi:hypothetical protein
MLPRLDTYWLLAAAVQHSNLSHFSDFQLCSQSERGELTQEENVQLFSMCNERNIKQYTVGIVRQGTVNFTMFRNQKPALNVRMQIYQSCQEW